MKFDEVKTKILTEGTNNCLVSETNSTYKCEKRKIYFRVAEDKVVWTAYKEIHEEKPVDNSNLLFISNAKIKKEGSMTVEEFKAITAEEFSKVIQQTEEEVLEANCGEYPESSVEA